MGSASVEVLCPPMVPDPMTLTLLTDTLSAFVRGTKAIRSAERMKYPPTGPHPFSLSPTINRGGVTYPLPSSSRRYWTERSGPSVEDCVPRAVQLTCPTSPVGTVLLEGSGRRSGRANLSLAIASIPHSSFGWISLFSGLCAFGCFLAQRQRSRHYSRPGGGRRREQRPPFGRR